MLQNLCWVKAVQASASRCLQSDRLAPDMSLTDSERTDDNRWDNGVIWQGCWLQT